MSLLKKILKSKPVQTVICRVAWAYIWFVYLTTRWEIKGLEHTRKLAESGKPFIFVFWHGRLLMIAPFRPKKRKLHVVISTHNDGQLITKVMEYFGFHMIRGSSNKKDGLAAFKEVLRALKNNEIVAITPDGPRGPRMRIGGNVVKIAQMQNVPIIPVTYSISKCKILKSWDSFMLAKPFSRGIFIYGEPIYPPQKNDENTLENINISLENKLNELTKQADEMIGLAAIEPERI
jgi:lysophospholipid acyltransferase (LPLAT)-like uncharacterized protein